MSYADELFGPLHGKDILGEARLDERAVKVLVVEDSTDYAALVMSALRQTECGRFEVVCEERLDAAINQIEHVCFDAMLLDLGLPDSDREQTIERATSIARRLPVIVLTGTEDAELATRAREHGAEDYLVKDRLDRAELPSTILRAIKRHRRLGGGASTPIVCRVPED